MTGRTHDLAAFTALTVALVLYSPEKITLATAIVAFSVNMIGGLAPDIDQSTSSVWRKVRAGNIIGRFISPLLGGHRYISHSIVGVIMFGIISRIILDLSSSFLIIQQDIVWWAFMIGFISHLIADMFTREGVPLLFPIPLRFGFPPLRFMRIKTGGLVEKSFVFPILIFANGLLYYYNYKLFLDFLKSLR